MEDSSSFKWIKSTTPWLDALFQLLSRRQIIMGICSHHVCLYDLQISYTKYKIYSIVVFYRHTMSCWCHIDIIWWPVRLVYIVVHVTSMTYIRVHLPKVQWVSGATESRPGRLTTYTGRCQDPGICFLWLENVQVGEKMFFRLFAI